MQPTGNWATYCATVQPTGSKMLNWYSFILSASIACYNKLHSMESEIVWPLCGFSNCDQSMTPLSIKLCESLCINQQNNKAETEGVQKMNHIEVTNEIVPRTWSLLSHHHRRRFSQSGMSNPPQRHLVLELGRPCQWAFRSAQVRLFQQPKSKATQRQVSQKTQVLKETRRFDLVLPLLHQWS